MNAEETTPERDSLQDIPVKLEIFEGPLDLLLHLIRENKVEITDIPIASITEQYLQHLDLMRTLNLDVAGDAHVHQIQNASPCRRGGNGGRRGRPPPGAGPAA
jgi:hypothetical protein